MKKLLMVAALLAVGAVSYSLGVTYTDNDSKDFNSRYVGGEKVSGIFGDKWYDVTDSERDEDQINRFLKKGRGWRDDTLMAVLLTVHQPIKIKPETYLLIGEGVKGDKLEFGDVEFIVSGTKDAKASFYFIGDVFDMMKVVSLEYQGNVDVKSGNGLNGEFIETTKTIELAPDGGPHTGPDEVSIEMDMYFKLTEVGHSGGLVFATAYYE